MNRSSYLDRKQIASDLLSADELMQGISEMTTLKRLLTSKISVLKKDHTKVTDSVYLKILSMNEDQANKYYKNAENGLTYSDRIDASTKNLYSDIKKLEMTLEVQTSADDELGETELTQLFRKLMNELCSFSTYLEKCLLDLTLKEAELESLQLKSKIRIKDSAEYHDISEQINKSVKEMSRIKYHLPSTLREISSQPRTNRHVEAVFPEKSQFDDAFAIALEQNEIEIQKSIDALHSALKAKASLTTQLLDTEMQQTKKALSMQRALDMEAINAKYDAILEDFLIKNEETSQRHLERFETKLNILKQTPIDVTASSITEDHSSSYDELKNDSRDNENVERSVSWKTEIDSRFSALFAEDAECQRLEQEVDQLLLDQMNETRVDISEQGLDPAYLESLMNTLAALYAETNASFTSALC